jgi:hypothetical protein
MLLDLDLIYIEEVLCQELSLRKPEYKSRARVPDLRRIESMGFRRQSATGEPALLKSLSKTFKKIVDKRRFKLNYTG